MLKLMIVDDEPFARKALCQAIDWKKEGCLVEADCRNGKEALDLMETVRPDIVITDVRMPFMNGVELAKELRRNWPETLVIMISGYEEFEYAKAAVNYGVFAYLLKPLDTEEFLETLRRAEKRVTDRKLLNSIQVTDRRIYEEVLRGTFQYDKYEEEHELLQKLGELYHVVVMVCISGESGGWAGQAGVNTDKIQAGQTGAQAGQYLLSLNKEQTCLHLPDITKNSVYLLKSRNQKKLQKELELFCERAAEILRGLKLPGFCVTASRIKQGLDELPAALYEAENMEKMRYLIEDHAVYYADKRYTVRYADFHMEVQSMTAATLQKDREEIYKELNRQFKRFTEEKVSIYQVKDFVKAVMLRLMTKIDAVDFNERAGEYIVKLYFSMDLQSAKDVLESFTAECLNFFNRTSELTTNAMLTMAKEYMAKNFQNPELSLSEVAEYVHLNPSYFSTVFSRYCKVTFIGYLAKLRLSSAQEKLIYTDKKIAQIAEETGYSNITYFCRNFKKLTGLSPKEYRNENRKES